MANFNQSWNQNNTFPNQNVYSYGGGPQNVGTQIDNRSYPYTGMISTGLSGKTVNSPQEILPQDVPMNGFTSYFPKADGSEIYAKCWNSNGTIDTRTYILKPLEEPTSTEPDIMSQILSRLEAIERKVSYKPKYQNQRKEVKPNE